MELKFLEHRDDERSGDVTSTIRPCGADDMPDVLRIINAAAVAYRGTIPADRWHEPYMPMGELQAEIAAGVRFTRYIANGALVPERQIETSVVLAFPALAAAAAARMIAV